MNNLLSDSFTLSEGDTSRYGDIEMGTQAPVSTVESGLEDFFKKIRSVEKEIEKLSNILKKLQDANEESKKVTSPAAMKAIKHQMEKDTDEALKVARLAKSKVEELERENSASRQKPGSGPGPSVDRSRTSTTEALKRKLKDKITEFQTLREKNQQEYWDVVERMVYTVTGTHADEKLIETGNSEHIFQKAIQEQGRGQIINTIAEIQERHDAVKEVEKKLLELQQLFLDMSVLVQSQGDMLNNIEAEVSKTVEHVNSGVNALQKARFLQKNTRKWTCIAIIILLIIILVIVLSIRPWK